MVKRRPQEAGSGVGESLRAALLTSLEQRGEEWLLSLLDAALVTLFAEAVRAVVERQAEEYLRSLLRTTFGALPKSVGSRAVQQEMELTLLALLRESLDVLFSEVIQAELRAHGEQAIQGLLRRDMDAARHVGERVVHMLGQELLDVLRQQRQQMLRLLLRTMVLSFRLRLASQHRD
jgi:hypothetical protein